MHTILTTRRRALVIALCLGLLVVALGALTASAVDTTIVVQPEYTTTVVPANNCPGLSLENWSNNWFTCDENTTTSPGTITLAPGPGTPPLGNGSAQFNVNDIGDGPYMFTVFQNGLRLDDISQLTYETYYATGDGDNNRPVLQINVDYDLTDADANWQGRLIWIPKWAGCVTLTDDNWQTLDPINNAAGCWMQTGTPRVGGSPVSALYSHNGPTAATWAQIMSAYPNAGVHGTFGAFGFKIGSGESAGKASLDNFKVGFDTGGGEDVTIWDFEPDVPCTTVCYADAVNGNDLNGGASAADAKKTIQAAVNAVNSGGQVIAAAGTYPENVTIPKSLTLTGAGQTNDAAGTILEGTGKTGSGIFINNNITDVTIENLRVQNYNLSAAAGVYANQSNHGLTVQNVTSVNNGLTGQNGGGIYMNGPVDDVLLTGNTITNNRNRGIVIWNGFKTNITITNNTVTGNNCCGIELQDGTASGVTVTGNTVTGNLDSGMAFTGLMAGAGPNLIANNTVTDNGRFGIEIKLPNGTGLDTGDGSIVVEDNDVSLTSTPADLRDYGGIVVIRRGFLASENNVNIPTGVIVRDNTVSGYAQTNGASSSEGFGIVVEGTNMTVTGNTLNNNDVGAQVQGGHTPYTANASGDGDQSNLADTYFGRGNSPVGCADVNTNTFTGNTIDFRVVGTGGGLVRNVDTGETFCGIQAAINDSDTVNGHTLEVSAGTYAEAVNVNKSLTITGADALTTIVDPPAGNGFSISANNVTLMSMTAQGGTSGASISGPLANITIDGMRIINNTSYAVPISNSLSAATNIKVLNSYFSGNTIGVRMSSTTIVDGLLIEGSTFENQSFGFYQANDSNNGHVKNLHVTDSTFANLSSHAVYFEEGYDVEVDNSTFTGNFSGVYLYDGYDSSAQGGLSGNVNIYDNTFTDHKYAAVRVRAVDNDLDSNTYGLNGPFNVFDNTFNQNVGAFNTGSATVTVSPVIEVTLGSGGSHEAVDITDNAITFSGAYNTATAAYGIMVRGGVDEVNITGNTIDGGGVGTNGGTPPSAGIYVVSNSALYGALKATSLINVTQNLLNNLPNGVIIYDEVNAVYGGVTAGATLNISRNDLSANTAYGIQSGPATDSDGTCNWWGDASGPGPVGSGSDVSSDVIFNPFLTTADLDGPCYPIGAYFFSAKTPGNIAGMGAYGSEDILMYDGSDWSIWFDGSLDAGLNPKKTYHNIDAFSIPDPLGDDLYISFTRNQRPVPGIYGIVDGMDVVHWDGTAFSLLFDGQDVGLQNLTAENVDALHVLPGSEWTATPDVCLNYLLISTKGAGNVPKPGSGLIKFSGEDVLGFCLTQAGADTTGLWTMVLDGSTVGMNKGSTDSISLSGDGNTLFLTTLAKFTVNGVLMGNKSMVYAYDMVSQTFSGPIFIAPTAGLMKDVDGLHISE